MMKKKHQAGDYRRDYQMAEERQAGVSEYMQTSPHTMFPFGSSGHRLLITGSLHEQLPQVGSAIT